MELQEAIRLAEQGDRDMMFILGKYYMNNEDDQSVETGWMWIERAANAGQLDALPIMCQYYETMAKTSEAANCYTLAMDYWRRAVLHVNHYEELGCAVPEMANMDASVLKERASGIRYQFALCSYMTDNYSDILQLYSHPETVEEQLLYGLTLTQVAPNSSWDERQVFQLLSCVTDIPYSKKEKSTSEECVYATAVLIFSKFLRLGLVTPVNLEAAYNVLSTALPNLKDADYIQVIRSELSHYQKKMFGGYKYTG